MENLSQKIAAETVERLRTAMAGPIDPAKLDLLRTAATILPHVSSVDQQRKGNWGLFVSIVRILHGACQSTRTSAEPVGIPDPQSPEEMWAEAASDYTEYCDRCRTMKITPRDRVRWRQALTR